jgi:hypothetical protein
MTRIEEEVGGEAFLGGEYPEAQRIFEELVLAPDLADFLTLPAYERILTLTEPTRPDVRLRSAVSDGAAPPRPVESDSPGPHSASLGFAEPAPLRGPAAPIR